MADTSILPSPVRQRLIADLTRPSRGMRAVEHLAADALARGTPDKLNIPDGIWNSFLRQKRIAIQAAATRRDWQTAVGEWLKVIVLGRAGPSEYAQMAALLERAGQRSLATRAARLALESEPQNVLARRTLALAQRVMGQTHDAVLSAAALARSWPLDSESWFTIFTMLRDLDRHCDARLLFEKGRVFFLEHPARHVFLPAAFEAMAPYEPQIPEDVARRMTTEERFACQWRLGHFDAANDPRPTQLMEDLPNIEARRRLKARAPANGLLTLPNDLFRFCAEDRAGRTPCYSPVGERVLMINSSLGAGGAERQIIATLKGVSARGHRDLNLSVRSLDAARGHAYFLDAARACGTAVALLPRATIRTEWPPALAAAAKKSLLDLLPDELRVAVLQMSLEILRVRPSILHAWQNATVVTTGLAAMLAGVPRIVLSLRSILPRQWLRQKRRYTQAAYRAFLSHPHVCLTTNSHATADDLREVLQLPAAPVTVIPNGVNFTNPPDDSLQARTETRAALGIGPGVPLVGAAFRLVEEKRPLLFVEVASRIAQRRPDCRFVIFGDGPMREVTQALVHARGLGAVFTFAGMQEDIFRSLAALDLMLVTSRVEGLPNSVIEAQAAGVPVVSVDVGGIGEIVQHGSTGLLTYDDDPGALAGLALFALTNKDWLKGAGGRAAERANTRFGMEQMVDRTLDAYKMRRRNG